MVDAIICAIVGLVILYVIVRIAVREGMLDALAKAAKNCIFSQLEISIRNGNIEAHHKISKDDNNNEADGNSIDQTLCPNCNAKHDYF